MVLGRLQGDDRAAVGNGHHARLLAVQPLLEHESVAGRAEDLLHGDLFDGPDRLVAIGADDDPLAGRPGRRP